MIPSRTLPCRQPQPSLRCHQTALVVSWIPQTWWEVHWSADNCWRLRSHSGGGNASLPAEARSCSCAWGKREEKSTWQKGERGKIEEQTYLPFIIGRKSESKLPGDVTRWHHLPERADLRPSPPTASPLLLLQVRLQVVFGSTQPALDKIERGYRTACIRRECISGFSDPKQICTCCSPSCR